MTISAKLWPPLSPCMRAKVMSVMLAALSISSMLIIMMRALRRRMHAGDPDREQHGGQHQEVPVADVEDDV
jgi:hypothetical protein